jgi:hypothetical protein
VNGNLNVPDSQSCVLVNVTMTGKVKASQGANLTASYGEPLIIADGRLELVVEMPKSLAATVGLALASVSRQEGHGGRMARWYLRWRRRSHVQSL